MAIFEDEPVKRPVVHSIGQDLSDLSVEELAQRISLLESEIVRLQEEMKAKSATLSTAEALFRRN